MWCSQRKAKRPDFPPPLIAPCVLVTATLAVLLVTCASASAQTDFSTDSRWAVRTAESNNGSRYLEGVEQTRCAPLQYFLENPKNFEYKADLVVPRQEASAHPGAVRESARSGRVGEIMGFTIYYVIHKIEYDIEWNNEDQYPSFVKLILVQRKSDEYCAIFNEQGMEAELLSVEPPYFVDADSQTVLVSRDPVNGNCGCFQDAYWTFDKDGPIFLETSDVIAETQGNFFRREVPRPN